MTDKQIIIDGVDVSGCECYSEHREDYCGWHTPCEGDTCPYKLKWALQQLKRKEQECEKWKSNFNGKVFAIEELLKQLDQLKAELHHKTEYIQEQRDIINQYSKEIEMYKKCQGKRASKREEELKAENDELKRQYKELGQCSKGLKDYYDKEKETLSNRFLELKQTLTEIKEIAESNKKYIYVLPSYSVAGDSIEFSFEFIKQILQKISEVEDE